MGDVGDYWREHKEHQQLVARRKQGITASHERQWERERIKKKKEDHFDRCTIKCECGKWFLDIPAHNCHKSHMGKAGHKLAETKEAKQKDSDWTDLL